MKNARLLSVAVLGFCAFATGAIADPTSADSQADPYTQTDPDGVPLFITQGHAARLTPQEIDALKKNQAQAADDKNWLVRGYEKQLQSHTANSTPEQSGNLYYELGSNKDLARLAGMPDLDEENQLSFRTGAPHSTRAPEQLHPDNSPRMGGPPTRNMTFKPLITPLGSPEVAGVHNFLSSSPHATVTPFYSSLNGSSPASVKPAPARPRADDPQDLETPGLIAAQKDPLADPSATDLTLDLLPGETIEHAKAHQDAVNTIQLPVPASADQLHKTQAAKLSVPGIQNLTKAPVSTAPPKPAKDLAPDPNAPMQASEVPQINAVRAPIPSPFNMLPH